MTQRNEPARCAELSAVCCMLKWDFYGTYIGSYWLNSCQFSYGKAPSSFALVMVESFFGQQAKISQADIFHVFENARLRGIFKRAILNGYMTYLSHREAHEIKRPLAFCGGDILQMDISNRGIKLAAILIVLQIDSHDCFLYLCDVKISNEKILQIPAARGVRFEADCPNQVWAAHRAVFDEHVADAAAHFAA